MHTNSESMAARKRITCSEEEDEEEEEEEDEVDDDDEAEEEEYNSAAIFDIDDASFSSALMYVCKCGSSIISIVISDTSTTARACSNERTKLLCASSSNKPTTPLSPSPPFANNNC